MKQLLTLLLVLVLCTASIASTPDDKSGQVQLPLEEYRHLIEALADPSPRPAPARYALGSASVTVGVTDVASRATGTIQVRLIVEVLEDQWVLVPVLPAGTPVESVKVGGKPVQLIATPHGLAWSTRKSGSYTMDLAYRVDARRSGRGFTLPVPVPEAAAVHLTGAGKRAIEELLPRRVAAIHGELAALTPAEQDELRRLCRKLGRRGDN